jgi:hypothetical protein
MKGTRHGSATVEFPSDREVLVTRQFDAPAELVFDVLTKPEHVRVWFGAKELEGTRTRAARWPGTGSRTTSSHWRSRGHRDHFQTSAMGHFHGKKLPTVQETDALLVCGGDVFYLGYRTFPWPAQKNGPLACRCRGTRLTIRPPSK